MVVKDIPGFPNYTISEDATVTNKKLQRKITPVLKRYYEIRLSKEGKVHHKSVHRLVYESFNGLKPPGMHIDHIDGNRLNNHISNLRAVSPADNQANQPLKRRGTQVNTSKLNEDIIREIRKRKENGDTYMSLAEEYGVCKSSIVRIVSRKNWSHVR